MARLVPQELTRYFRPVNLKWSGCLAEERQNPVGSAFQHFALRARARQDTDAEQHAQQQLGEFVRRTGVCDRTVFLPRLDTAATESLDEDHLLGDELLEFGIIGRQFQRRVDEHAAAALLVINRPLDDLVEEGPDR